ncbi:proteasome accessory factor A [Pseudokineococcus lusitanus]|uniref:Proteasome accessory factor A n=2 Tax=Pseudokineococcus lusitanus TaxID=763993 RepID=A0A3N1HSN3_9ACTN|nr:depupylase/deamidase Dop [Pseudokineococcus lusitanus]ROP45511.1 proteasome accessory factor A [Pseudokineococcus lusitanus]
MSSDAATAGPTDDAGPAPAAGRSPGTGGRADGPWGRDGGVRRVMGLETEFGISAPGEPGASAVVLSGRVVAAYAQPAPGSGPVRRGRRPTRWDYADEAPLRDARGFELDRARAHASQLTDVPPDVAAEVRPSAGLHVAEELEEAGLANTVLTNGARLYVDHAHPEYSGPEVTTPRDAVLWDLAGDEVAREAMRRVSASPGLGELVLYKNNTDGKGASYGTHENYLVPRSVPFRDLVRALVPFFVSRQVVAGAGRVGRGQTGEQTGFQLSQRADFFETEVGLETTLKRPLVNTRDEPHATAELWRRLHVIVGDANLSPVATLLKTGTTSLVLAMVEAGEMPDLSVEQPVAAVRAVSHDPSLQHLLTLRTGERLTAVQLQWRHLEAARAFVARRQGDAVDPDTAEVLDRWEQVLTDLEADPLRCADRLDWVAKLRLLEGFRRREDLSWDAARLHLIDIQYADLRPERGLHARLVGRGAVETLHTPAEVAHAVTTPPEDTRAWFRGECVRRYGDAVAAASWDSVVLDVPGRTSLQRVPVLEPLRGTRAAVGALLDRCGTAADLVAALTGGRPAS